MQDKKLFLLDAYALIYRAFYALIRAPRITSAGFNTSAIYGFCNTLEEVLRKEDPAYIAVCFDPPGDTFRHEAYADYKAQRQKQPEDITLAVPFIKRILAAYRIPVIECPGYEADDVIGTLARRAFDEGFTTFMMTPDKDYAQLVNERTLQYRPSLGGQGFEVRGPAEVCERFEVAEPLQVIDLLALEGDASDNIPGCPGVGKKTAVKLIAEWGSVENLIANADKVKGAVGKKIADNAEQIRFSKFLATIKTDCDVPFDPDELRRKEPDVDALAAIYDELQFKTLAARLGPRKPAAPAPQPSLFDGFDDDAPAAPAAPQTSVAATAAEVADAIEAVLADGAEVTGIAAHITGDDAMTATLRGIAVDSGKRSVYIAVPDFDTASIATLLAPLFAARTTLACHDVKRLMVVLRRMDVMWTAPSCDTSVAHYLLAPETPHDLPTVAEAVLGRRTADFALSTLERRKQIFATDEDAAPFFGERASLTRALCPVLADRLAAEGLADLWNDIEAPMVAVLAAMEYEGVRIDPAVLAAQSRHLSARLADLERQVYELAGMQFNIGSPSQVGKVLFETLGIDPGTKRTKSGAYSTSEEILEKLAPAHPIVGLILEIRGLKKLLATYIDALPGMINPATGKLHTTFNQVVTATGRISSTNPNIQNIPIRTDDGREIRRAFIADPGCLIMSADYSQIELRLMADLSGDPDMVGAFNAGHDIHRATAARIYRVDLDQVTDSQRRNAKTANFGIIYGISAFGLSERLAIPRAEAKDLIEGYLATYPKVREYMDGAVADARSRGYVTTRFGRRRYLPDINSRNAGLRGYAERNAVNAPLQGTAADIIKLAMVRIDRRISREGLRSRMIMQVHDELVFNVHPDELDTLRSLVVEEMEHAYSGSVTLEVAAGVGHNWLEAH